MLTVAVFGGEPKPMKSRARSTVETLMVPVFIEMSYGVARACPLVSKTNARHTARLLP
jgi:hypothetical protein